MKSLGLNPTQFADEIGVQRSSISHILSGRNNPSLDLVTKILNRFKDVDSNWLILGKGSLFSISGEKDFQDENIKFSEPSIKHNNGFAESLFDDIQEDNRNINNKNKISDLEKKIEILEKHYKEKDFLQNSIEESKTKKSLSVNKNLDTITEPESIGKILKESNQDRVDSNPSNEVKHIKKIIVFYSDNSFEEFPKN
jgi:transcriptional regulator with XRE-family HTH domain